MKNYDALIGVSLNPEIYFQYKNTPDEKGLIDKDGYLLSGSSANIAGAFVKMKYDPLLLGLVSASNNTTPENTITNMILRKLLHESKIRFLPLKALTRTNIAYVPINGAGEAGVIGAKGEVLDAAITTCCNKIRTAKGKWRIASGVRIVEVPFINALYENSEEGFCTLTPKVELVADTVRFKKLIKSVDLLIMNAVEFQAAGLNHPCELHKFGPKLIIVTKDKEGGIWSFNQDGTHGKGSYESVHYTNKIASKVGAGDWFHAAFVVSCMDIKKSILQLSQGDIEKGLYFAARVAGKKLTYLGGANGPGKNELFI